MSGHICDVCGAPALGVASSSLGAISLTYCQLCGEFGAEPYGLTVGMAAVNQMVHLDDFAPWCHEMLFATLLRAGKTSTQFWANVSTKIVEMSADFGDEFSRCACGDQITRHHAEPMGIGGCEDCPCTGYLQ